MEAFATCLFTPNDAEIYRSTVRQEGGDVLAGLINSAASEAARYAFLAPDGGNQYKCDLYEQPQTISFHPHPLNWRIPYGTKSRWVCDICQSQHGGKKSGPKESWHCSLCSFDLCRECFRFVRKRVNYEDGFIKANYGRERKSRSCVEMLPMKKLKAKNSTLLEELPSKDFLSTFSELDSDSDTCDLDQDAIDLKLATDSTIECFSEDGSVQVMDEVVHISFELNQNLDETQQTGDDSVSRIDDCLSGVEDGLSHGELDTSLSEEELRDRS